MVDTPRFGIPVAGPGCFWHPFSLAFFVSFFFFSRAFFFAGADYLAPQELFALSRNWLPEEAGGGADPSGLFQCAPLVTVLQKTALHAKFLRRSRAALDRGPVHSCAAELEGCCVWSAALELELELELKSGPLRRRLSGANRPVRVVSPGPNWRRLLFMRLQTSHCARTESERPSHSNFYWSVCSVSGPNSLTQFCYLRPPKKKKATVSANSHANHIFLI